jgi:tRNA pseudouridine38-40 synthase
LQPGKPTFQLRLEEAVQSLTGGFSRIYPSGRTDAGVHARAQIVHFDSESILQPADFYRGLNALLPPDIRVNSVRKAPAHFNARFDATRKEYRYFIWNHRVFDPFHRPFRTHVPTPLDVTSMASAASLLQGRHDFASFTANARREVNDTVRHLDLLSVRQSGSLITIRAAADGFLYKMVRSLAGLLMRVGSGKTRVDEVVGILEARARDRQVPTAPAQGLFLWKVWYGVKKTGSPQGEE